MSTRPQGHTAEPPKLISAEINFGLGRIHHVYDGGRNPQQNKKLLLLHCQLIVSYLFHCQ